jgi:CheY-like chemotaxis protein
MADKQYKILLVEDEPELAEIFHFSLKSAGLNTELLREGSRVLQTIKRMKPDLVLLDLVIPNKDGYEILKEMKLDNTIKNIKVYVFSNLTQAGEIDKAMKLGAKGYLVKSDYTPAKLTKKVKDILETD